MEFTAEEKEHLSNYFHNTNPFNKVESVQHDIDYLVKEREAIEVQIAEKKYILKGIQHRDALVESIKKKLGVE